MTDATTLLATADDLEQRVNALPKIKSDGPGELIASHRAHRAAAEALAQALREDHDARIIDRPAEGVRMTMLGVTTTCTGGMAGACRNWIAAARRKAGAR